MSNKQVKKRANGEPYRAWGDVMPDGSTMWMIATDEPICVFAEVTTRTERTKRQDMSGLKKYRFVTKTHCDITFRVSWGQNVKLQDDYFFYAGEKETVRQLIKMMTADNWPTIVEMDMETQARKMGVDERRIFNARFDFNGWNEDGLRGCRNLYRLMNEQKED